MGIIWFLIVFPLVAAALCVISRDERLRGVIVCVSACVIAAGSIVLAAQHLGGTARYYAFSSVAISIVLFIVELALCAYIMWRSLSARKYGVFALACVQALLACVAEFGPSGSVEVHRAVYIDTLSSIMVLVIGIIGSGICVYAVGYMRDFQRHQDELARQGKEFSTDRQGFFFAVMFAFLSGMFGIVTFNDLAWMLCAWEVTTVCSFYLIGYTKTAEATANSFRQIWMNLIGGIAFATAVIFIGVTCSVMELDRFIAIGTLAPTAAMLPVALLALASLTKAAQMPFHTWLLGAMVAPTPTSALLHSSTMVKAGVFLLIRLSPLMGVYVSGLPRMGINPVGFSVILVGCITFLLASLIAVSQSNAKRVLAYSTIANLGLIVTCAGIGSAAAVWAAIFLLIFHACAKSLLFLCVGTAEHHIGSRNIEDMDSLITRMPKLAVLMAFGICGMFIAPFGMLVSKWAALGAFVNSGVIVIVIMLAFGSAATFFFWAKWLAKIVAGDPAAENVEGSVHTTEWCALGLMALLLAACSIFLPAISSGVVTPYVRQLTGGVMRMPSAGDLVLMAVCAFVMIAIPLVVALRARSIRRGDGHQPYFGGVGHGHAAFMDSMGQQVAYTQRNWYLEGMFSEEKIGMIGTVLCTIIAFMGISASVGLAVVFFGSVI
ncbi:MAG: proton-conducting transporter membrane subunit [Coriobacteriales bacterium]